MILRAVKDSRWSAINNTVLNDERLSWRARGIAAYLLTKPDNWRIDHTHLWRAGREGRDAVLAAMKELEICGYLIRKRYQKPDGKFATEVQLHETPQPKTDFQETDFQGDDSPQPNTDFQEPTPENQESVNQESVFQDSLLILKPITESKGDEDDLRVRDPIHAAWFETYDAEMPANLEKSMTGLLVECNEAAVIHAIKASIGAESRSFRYIAQCARNYVPTPTKPPAANSYRVDLPALPSLPAIEPPRHSFASLPSDPWSICVSELSRTLPGGFVPTLSGSHLEAAGTVPDANGKCFDLYRVLIAPEQAVKGLDYFSRQAGPSIRKGLSSILGKPVLIEIVAATIEPIEELTHA